jgi:prephenate dehydrogenase
MTSAVGLGALDSWLAELPPQEAHARMKSAVAIGKTPPRLIACALRDMTAQSPPPRQPSQFAPPSGSPWSRCSIPQDHPQPGGEDVRDGAGHDPGFASASGRLDVIEPELARLRDEISRLDRELLDALNRRLELVAAVQEHKRETGAGPIDAGRETELLQELTASNPGPLSAGAVATLFAAVLDVMKHETRRGTQREMQAAAPARVAQPRLAVVGTGLLGTSVALAARRAGASGVLGWDAQASTLRDAAGAGAVEASGSLRDAVADAELVVVAVPVGSLVATVKDVLAAAPTATVTDVGSTKRALAAVPESRFVPGHPLAGGSTGGPGRASADLFDGAVWVLTPLPATEPSRLEAVERFVASLGARPVRLEPEHHDRLLAFTSHLPHAVANVLMRVAAGAGDDALGYAGASLREMTRVAGANPEVWADIFIENGDLIADALAAQGDALAELATALRTGDRESVEAWIAEAGAARNRMLEYAYRTEARQLHRIRVRVPDRPGVLARITQTLGTAEINIEDFELRHVSPEYGGVLVILVAGAEKAELARTLLRHEGYSAV